MERLILPKDIRIVDTVLEKVRAQCPEYLSPTAFINQLVDQSLTRGLDYAPTVSVREEPSTSRESKLSSETVGAESTESKVGCPLEEPPSPQTRKREVRNAKVKRTKSTPEFDRFWTTYQSSPKKANCQSKAKAWECWTQLVPDVSPDDLINAAQKAVDEVNSLEALGDFCAPLPDAFRWLRDERYVVLLEDHTPARSNKPSYLCY